MLGMFELKDDPVPDEFVADKRQSRRLGYCKESSCG